MAADVAVVLNLCANTIHICEVLIEIEIRYKNELQWNESGVFCVCVSACECDSFARVSEILSAPTDDDANMTMNMWIQLGIIVCIAAGLGANNVEGEFRVSPVSGFEYSSDCAAAAATLAMCAYVRLDGNTNRLQRLIY